MFHRFLFMEMQGPHMPGPYGASVTPHRRFP